METRPKRPGLEPLLALDAAARPEFPCYAELRSGNFNEALQALELNLTQSPDCLESKLCWVLCQLELNNVPVAALTAPLEEAFPKIKDRPDLDALSVACLLRLGLKLTERGQNRIAAITLERALELARRGHAFPSDALEALRSELVELLEEELQKPDSRREARQNRAGLEEKLRQIRAFTFERKAVESEKPATNGNGPKKPLNSKTVLESAFHDPEEEWRLESEPNQPHPETLFESLTPDSKNSRKNLAVISVTVCLLALVVLALFSVLAGPGRVADLELAMAFPPSETLSLAVPELQRLDSTTPAQGGDVPSLDRVKERLTNLAMKPAAPENEKPPETPPEPEPEPAYYDPKQPQPPLPGPPRPTQPVKEDTRKLPVLDPSRLGNTRVENMGGSGGRGPSGVAVGTDGRPYGPPLDSKTSGIALDGSRLQGYPVEQLNKPALYRTLAATKVLDAPSVLAKPLDNLSANAKVQVVSRMGKWLELRSSGGRRGYIFAQDAVEISE